MIIGTGMESGAQEGLDILEQIAIELAAGIRPEAVGADMALGRDAAERLARLPDLEARDDRDLLGGQREARPREHLGDAGGRHAAAEVRDEVGQDRVVDGERLKAGHGDPDAVALAHDLVARARVAHPARPVRELVVEHARGGDRRARERLVLLDGGAHIVARHPERQRVAGRDRRPARRPRSSRARPAARRRSCAPAASAAARASCSGACSRAATTASQAGSEAAIRGRSEVSIGIP